MLCAERTSQLCELVIFSHPFVTKVTSHLGMFFQAHTERVILPVQDRAHLNYSTHARECKAAHILFDKIEYALWHTTRCRVCGLKII